MDDEWRDADGKKFSCFAPVLLLARQTDLTARHFLQFGD